MRCKMEFYNRQIDKALKKAHVIQSVQYPKIVMFSDCHRGSGAWNDNFLNNKTLFSAALNYYYDNGYAYVEIGDGDELWENRCFQDIYQIHEDIFQQLLRFYLEHRLFLLWGNHDKVKKYTRFRSSNSFFAPPFYESLIIEGIPGCEDLCLLHGHQADPLNNQFWKAARWMVRYLWKPLELAGVKDPTSAARNYTKKKKVENRMAAWVESRHTSLIAGHTHRPVLSMERGPAYYNAGSCVHPNTITCMELTYEKIALVKWTACVDEKRYLYVCRQVLAGPKALCSPP